MVSFSSIFFLCDAAWGVEVGVQAVQRKFCRVSMWDLDLPCGTSYLFLTIDLGSMSRGRIFGSLDGYSISPALDGLERRFGSFVSIMEALFGLSKEVLHALTL